LSTFFVVFYLDDLHILICVELTVIVKDDPSTFR